MKRMNPNLKIFAFMIDPVSRLFSHLNMCMREHWRFCKKQTLEQVRGQKPKFLNETWWIFMNYYHILKVMQKVTNYLSKYNSTEFVETEEMKFGAFHRFIHVGNYALVTDIYQKHFEHVHFIDGLSLLRQGFHIYLNSMIGIDWRRSLSKVNECATVLQITVCHILSQYLITESKFRDRIQASYWFLWTWFICDGMAISSRKEFSVSL